MRYLHTMVRVRDLPAALRFFCDGLGLRELRRRDHEAGRFTLEIVAMDEAARRWADVALDGDLAGTRVEWAITPTADGCQLDVLVELHAHGLLKRLMPVVWRTARRQLRTALDSLTRVLEAGRAAPAAP